MSPSHWYNSLAFRWRRTDRRTGEFPLNPKIGSILLDAKQRGLRLLAIRLHDARQQIGR
ncbi:MAG: hypothetical protein MI924_15440 [Chloroflexales bacterium]|nr:hypothetical protein [Chloroflexales bacterium]